MRAYVAASVQLRAVLGDGPGIEGWDSWEVTYTSEIARVETRRTLDRLRLTNSLDDRGLAQAFESLHRFESGFVTLPLVREVLERAAEPLATVVGTLDAIHLASAVMVRRREPGASGLVFATHDHQQAMGARALGFAVVGVAL